MVGQHIGKYRVVDRVGRGGMGTVYRATDETLRRDVAIKVLNSGLGDPDVSKRFHAEAVTVARLSHPGIARIYELFEHKGDWLMVMELLSGETLEQLVERTGSLEPVDAAELCIQALAALAHAHSHGVVHRDLKPANIMVTDEGTVVIMDFGIARVAGTEHLTSVGFMMGTPAYMAPEQMLGQEIDARADLYAIGVVLYRLITATLPFKGETPFALAQAQVSNPPTPAAMVRPDLPAWVDEILSRALAKNPNDRFRSAMAFSEALSHAITGRPIGYSPTVAAHGVQPRASAPASMDVTVLATPTPQLGTVANAAPAGSGGRATLPLFEPAESPATPSVSPSRRPLWIAAALAATILVAASAYMVMPRSTSGAAAADSTHVPPATVPASTSPAPASTPSPAPPPQALAIRSAQPPIGVASPLSATRGAAVGERRAGTATTDPLLAVSDVRLLAVDGRKGRDEEVMLQFAGGQLAIVGRESGTTIETVRYPAILGATYVKARDPKWNPEFFSPPQDLDVGGVLRTSKHWLTLQAESSFVILRLEDSNVARVLEAVESRLALPVLRPVSGDRN